MHLRINRSADKRAYLQEKRLANGLPRLSLCIQSYIRAKHVIKICVTVCHQAMRWLFYLIASFYPEQQLSLSDIWNSFRLEHRTHVVLFKKRENTIALQFTPFLFIYKKKISSSDFIIWNATDFFGTIYKNNSLRYTVKQF